MQAPHAWGFNTCHQALWFIHHFRLPNPELAPDILHLLLIHGGFLMTQPGCSSEFCFVVFPVWGSWCPAVCCPWLMVGAFHPFLNLRLYLRTYLLSPRESGLFISLHFLVHVLCPRSPPPPPGGGWGPASLCWWTAFLPLSSPKEELSPELGRVQQLPGLQVLDTSAQGGGPFHPHNLNKEATQHSC